MKNNIRKQNGRGLGGHNAKTNIDRNNSEIKSIVYPKVGNKYSVYQNTFKILGVP